MENISQFISYSEAVDSATAIRNGIDNTPSPVILLNMKAVGENVHTPLRKHFGVPIYVTSFYRCPALNKLVGGSTTSQHVLGEAMDIVSRTQGVTNAMLFHWIVANLQFDQIIWEFGTDDEPQWVHVSFKRNGKNRRKKTKAIKAIVKGKEKTQYVDF